MIKAWALPTLIVLLGLTIFAQQSGVTADHNPEAEDQIRKLELRLCDLLVRGEWEEYASYVADDYVRTLAGGQPESKQEVMTKLRSAEAQPGATMVPEDMRVRVYGNAAVLTLLLTTGRKTSEGHEVRRQARITKTFIKRAGRWYLVSLASSGPTAR